MKVIIFLAIVSLTLAGLRGDRRRVPHSIPHHHATHHASRVSEHGNSNSENSEELFSLVGAIQDGVANAIQDTTNSVTNGLQQRADTVSNFLQQGADTICNHTQGVLCNVSQNIADSISSRLQQRADTLSPLINATGTDIAYATEHLNTTQITDDIDDGVALARTALKTAGDVMQVVNDGLSIAGLAFVDTNSLIKNHIQNTIETIRNDIQEHRANATNHTGVIKSDIQNAIQNIKSHIQGTVQNMTNDLTHAVESITPAEAATTGNDISSAIGTGLKLANSALGDVNDGLGIANKVIP